MCLSFRSLDPATKMLLGLCLSVQMLIWNAACSGIGHVEIDVIAGAPMRDRIVIDEKQVPVELPVGEYQGGVGNMEVGFVLGSGGVEGFFPELVAPRCPVGIEHGVVHGVAAVGNL